MTRVLVECYDVLYTYLKGDSRKNELYIAKHIEFFESQISFEVRTFAKHIQFSFGLVSLVLIVPRTGMRLLK